MKTKIIAAVLILFVAFSGISYADAGNKCKSCGDKKEFSMKDKFFEKIKFVHKNQEALEITDDQLAKIKDLKIKTKKELIRKHADIEVIKIDIISFLYQEKINVDAINKLIDKKYDIKKEKAKLLVSSLADLKGILTKDQCAKLKQCYKNKCGKCGKCPMYEKCQKEMWCKKCDNPKSKCGCK